MKLYRRVWTMALVFTGVVLSGSGCEVKTSKVQELTIFHTNDIHSHFRGPKTDPFGLGGLARVKTLLDRLRASTTHSLTLDAGDWSESGWYYSVDSGANMLQMLDQLGYDAVALGNHDFLAGPTQILERVELVNPSFPVLAANLDSSLFADAIRFDQATPKSTIKTVGSLKVGIIGLTTFEFLYDSYVAPVVITNPIDAATRIAKQMRPQVDVMLVVSHNTFETNMEVARAVPGVDAVISGHSHRKIPKAVLVQNAGRDVAVVETNEWAKFLGELKLTVDTSTHTVKYKDWVLHPVSADIAEDPAIKQFIEEQDQKLNIKFGQDVQAVVAKSDFLIQGNGDAENPIGNLAARAYRVVTGADLALEEVSLTANAVPSGDVTLMDLHDVMPHIYDAKTQKEWKVLVWNAKGSDLQFIINVFYQVSGLMPLGNPFGWLSADGAVIDWDPAASLALAPGLKLKTVIREIKIGGKQLDPSATYRVAMTEGLLYAMNVAKKTFNLKIDLTQITDSGFEGWQAIVKYATQVPALTRQEIGIGKKVYTQGPDLGVFYYSIDWDGKKISVGIENQGRAVANDISVQCFSGIKDDIVDFDTPSQKWTPIGESKINSLKSDDYAEVAIAWDGQKLQHGFWPVECRVISKGDSFSPNNTASRVFKW